MPPDVEALATLVVDTVAAAVGPVEVRLVSVETKSAEAADSLRQEITILRERVAVLEARAPEPGPAGPPGTPGSPGRDGKDGEAGRPGLEYCGVYVAGKTYEKGDVVTWAGCAWHCGQTTTAAPSEHGSAWSLMVKRGRDAREVRSAGR